MSYTVDNDLLSIMPERSLIQLSSDDPMAGVPDWAVVAEARAYADAQIDARIRQRYPLPLPVAPRELRDWALALARRWLYERRIDGPEMPAGVISAAKEAIDSLNAVRDGKMAIAVDDDGGDTAAVSAQVRISAPDRLFTTDLLGRY